MVMLLYKPETIRAIPRRHFYASEYIERISKIPQSNLDIKELAFWFFTHL